MSASTMAPPARTLAVFRHRCREDLLGGALIWAGFLVFVLSVTFVVSWSRPITVSGWDIASQLPRWYAGAVGVYLTAVYLPLYVAHGWTRREITRQSAPFAALFASMLGALMALGYVVERGVYSIAGWSQTLTQQHLFRTPTDVGLATLEFTMVFAVWIAAGAMVGAGFYRDPGLGLVSVPFGLAMLGAIEAATGPDMFAAMGRLLALAGIQADAATPARAAAVAAALIVVAAVPTWLLIRDMPIRSRGT